MIHTCISGLPEEVDTWGGSLIFIKCNTPSQIYIYMYMMYICVMLEECNYFALCTQMYDHVFHCNTYCTHALSKTHAWTITDGAYAIDSLCEALHCI